MDTKKEQYQNRLPNSINFEKNHINTDTLNHTNKSENINHGFKSIGQTLSEQVRIPKKLGVSEKPVWHK